MNNSEHDFSLAGNTGMRTAEPEEVCEVNVSKGAERCPPGSEPGSSGRPSKNVSLPGSTAGDEPAGCRVSGSDGAAGHEPAELRETKRIFR